jgi:hypothetical protein
VSTLDPQALEAALRAFREGPRGVVRSVITYDPMPPRHEQTIGNDRKPIAEAIKTYLEKDRAVRENELLREAFWETEVIFEDSRIDFVDVRVPRSVWLRLRAWRAADPRHGRPS